jgi:hypothetical protein
MKLNGMKEMKVTVVSVIVGLVGAFFTSWVLAHSLVFAGTFMKTSGIGLGLTTGFFQLARVHRPRYDRGRELREEAVQPLDPDQRVLAHLTAGHGNHSRTVDLS